MFSSRANYNKLKTNLRLCVQRLKLLEKKKTELALKARKEIADYIASGKEDRARIRVEHIIREDYMVEALEILELFCDLLLARFGLIETMEALDDGLREAVSSIIWATPRLQGDIPEFTVVNKHLTAKYSPEFAEACRKNLESQVNPKLEHKLSVHAPPKILVENYMIEIAKTYNVPFTPDENNLRDEPAAGSVASNLIDLGVDSGYSKAGEAYGLPVLPPVPAGPNTPHDNSPYPPPPPVSPPNSGYPPPPGGSMGGSTYQPPPNMRPNDVSAPPWTNPGLPPGFGYGNPPSPPPAYSGPVPSRPAALPRGGVHDTLPDLPAVPTPSPSFRNQTPGQDSAGGEDVDFDDLTRRFEELKKKT